MAISHKVIFPTISVPGLKCCRVTASRSHLVSHPAWHILSDATSVLRPLMARRYENVLDRRKHWRQQGLYVVVIGNTLSKGTKRVVRSWARRRVEQAIFEQLRFRGFDRLGRKLQINKIEGSGSQAPSRSLESEHGVAPSAANLKGTITVQLEDRIVDTPWGDLQQQAKLIVNEILRRRICKP